jgi:hypothetical protein
MTGQELITAMRESVLDDNAPPYLWSDTELLRSLNYAEVQACRRAQLIIDWSTANDSGTAATASTAGQQPLCVLTIVANRAVYTLSPRILQVKRVQLKSMTYPLLGPVSFSELDDRMSGWWSTAGTVGTAGSGGNPTYVINEPNNVLTFVQAPSVGDTAYLVVSRIPLISFTLRTSPEIEEKHHDGLMDWAAHLAFLKPDSDTTNPKLAQFYDDRFTARFGPLPDAYSEKMRKTLSQKERMRPREFGS